MASSVGGPPSLSPPSTLYGQERIETKSNSGEDGIQSIDLIPSLKPPRSNPLLEAAFWFMHEKKLISSNDVPSISEDFLEFLRRCFYRAINDPSSKYKIMLTETKIFTEPSLLREILVRSSTHCMSIETVLRPLVNEKYILSNQIDELAKEDHYKTEFCSIFNDALVSNNAEIVKIFRKTCIPQQYTREALINTDEVSIWLSLQQDFLIAKQLVCDGAHPLADVLKKLLHNACKEVNVNSKVIIILIDSGVSITPEDVYEIARANQYKIIVALLKKGCDISAALFELIRRKEHGAFQRLLEAGLDPNLTSPQGVTLLLQAVSEDDEYAVEALLKRGANPLLPLPNGQTIFEAAAGKGQRVLNLLYFPRRINGRVCRSSTYDSQLQAPEEQVLETELSKLASGKKAIGYYCLFIKVNTIVVALLKNVPFSRSGGISSSYGEASSHNIRKRVLCWFPQKQTYAIPEDLQPTEKSMRTIAFAIGPAIESQKEEAKLGDKKFAVRQLVSDFKSKDPSKESGFKYSFGEIGLHGHGPNPNAALAAFNQHRDGILRLKTWMPSPDVSGEFETLVSHFKLLEKLAVQDSENRQKLKELSESIDAFLTHAAGIISWKYTQGASKPPGRDEEQSVEETYNDAKTNVNQVRQHLFNTQRLNDWKMTIRQQVEVLQAMEHTLEEAKPMNVVLSELERVEAVNHLTQVKDLILNRTVTSAELPTVKIYSTTSLVENIFSGSAGSILVLKKAICHIIALNLEKIEFKPSEQLILRFSQPGFRKARLIQIEKEALFIARKLKTDDPTRVQDLASHYALLKETLGALDVMPPVRLDSAQMRGPDNIVGSLLVVHATHYTESRKLLNRLWLEFSFNEELLSAHLEEVLDLFTRRILLIDEEIREENTQPFAYPAFMKDDPKLALNEQLFLLQTSLLIALGQSKEVGNKQFQATPSTLELIKLRLKPAVSGSDKKKMPPYQFFIGKLVGTVKDIRGVLDSAESLPAKLRAPFEPLFAVLKDAKLEKKDVIDQGMIESFEALSELSPLPTLLPSASSIIAIVLKIQEVLKILPGKLDDKKLDSKVLVEKLKDFLNLASTALELDSKKGSPNSASLLVEIEKNPSVTLEEIKEKLRSVVGHDLGDKINQLLNSFKNVTDLEINLDKAKEHQKDLEILQDLIIRHLSKKSVPVRVTTDTIECRSLLDRLQKAANGKINDGVSKLRQVVEAIKNEEVTEKFAADFSSLTKVLDDFLKGKIGKAYVDEDVKVDMMALRELSKALLKNCLPGVLAEILHQIEECQSMFAQIFTKKLQQMSAQIQLGIREQIFYNTKGDNLRYYSWGGDKFDVAPYHNDNEAHLPLVEDDEWGNSQNRLAIQKRLNAQAYGNENGDDE